MQQIRLEFLIDGEKQIVYADSFEFFISNKKFIISNKVENNYEYGIMMMFKSSETEPVWLIRFEN